MTGVPTPTKQDRADQRAIRARPCSWPSRTACSRSRRWSSMRTIYREHGVRGETDERGSGSGSALLAARPAFRFDFSVVFNEIEMYGASIFSLRFRSMVATLHHLHPPPPPLAGFLRIGHTGQIKLEALRAAGRFPYRRVVFDAAHLQEQLGLLKLLKASGCEIVLDPNLCCGMSWISLGAEP
jgi:hypothetical protein